MRPGSIILASAAFLLTPALGRCEPASEPAAEERGDAALKAGDAGDALSAYREAIALSETGSAEETRLLEKAIDAARKTKLKPEIPEEAKHFSNRGMAYIKAAKGPDEFALASAELKKAVRTAPWWSNAYFNLARAQEKAGNFKGAAASAKLYLRAAPKAEDAEKMKLKIAELEVAQELADKKAEEDARIRPVGEACKSDAQCASGWCDKYPADSEAGVCAEGGACPFVYVVHGGKRRFAGEILRDMRTAASAGRQSLVLSSQDIEDGRLTVVVAERKRETTFIDHVYLSIDGRRVAPRDCGRSSPHCDRDMRHLRLEQGQSTALLFETGPIHADARVELWADGFYLPIRNEAAPLRSR